MTEKYTDPVKFYQDATNRGFQFRPGIYLEEEAPVCNCGCEGPPAEAGTFCGCALGALAMLTGFQVDSTKMADWGEVYRHLQERGYSPDWIGSVDDGFEKTWMLPESYPDYCNSEDGPGTQYDFRADVEGFRFGQAVRAEYQKHHAG